jgi:hypothetical protein
MQCAKLLVEKLWRALQGLFENGSAEELAGAEDVLRHHSIALEAECSSLDATIRTIQEMLARQVTLSPLL